MKQQTISQQKEQTEQQFSAAAFQKHRNAIHYTLEILNQENTANLSKISIFANERKKIFSPPPSLSHSVGLSSYFTIVGMLTLFLRVSAYFRTIQEPKNLIQNHIKDWQQGHKFPLTTESIYLGVARLFRERFVRRVWVLIFIQN